MIVVSFDRSIAGMFFFPVCFQLQPWPYFLNHDIQRPHIIWYAFANSKALTKKELVTFNLIFCFNIVRCRLDKYFLLSPLTSPYFGNIVWSYISHILKQLIWQRITDDGSEPRVYKYKKETSNKMYTPF